MINHRVNFYVDENGSWALNKFAHLLPHEIVARISSLVAPDLRNTEDVLAWSSSPDGLFSTKSTYLAISNFQPSPKRKLIRRVWKWDGPERITAFMWKAAHKSLLTNKERVRRHMAFSATCILCNAAEEALLHCFRDCPRVATIWLHLVDPNITNFFLESNWYSWLLENLGRKQTQEPMSCWPLLFGIALDTFWKSRNESVFSQTISSSQLLFWKIKKQMSAIQMTKGKNTVLRPLLTDGLRERRIAWLAPPLASTP